MPKKNLIKYIPKSTSCNIVLLVLILIITFNVFFGASDLAKHLFGSPYYEGLHIKNLKKKIDSK
jgi:hypothetical protein